MKIIGQLLDGRYRIVEVLSPGAFGQTYLAADTRRPGQPQCVVKLLRAPDHGLTITTHKTTHRLFQKEAEILEKLGRHPQIPLLLAYFEQDNQFYLVEEFIPGIPLNKEIIPGKPWQEKQVIKLLLEILEILGFVHGHEVIHRDVNPSNLIRRKPDGKLVLIDFGSVKEVSHRLAEGNGEIQRTIAIGTPSYMPMEQFQGLPQYNSDLYALGMIGIQALTGLPTGELPKLQDLSPSNPSGILWRNKAQCSSNLADILEKMVHYHYTQRYQYTEEVIIALKKINSGSEKVTPLELPKTTVFEMASRSLWFTLFGFASVGVIAVLVVVVSLLNRPNSRIAEKFFERGVELAKNGQRQEAIQLFDKAIKYTERPKYFYVRGNAYYELENYQNAIKDYNKATSLNPSYVNVYFNRGMAYFDQQNYDEAIDDFTQVLRLKPQDDEAYDRRGLVYYESQNYSKAIEDFTQVIKLRPNDVDAYEAYEIRGLAKQANNDLQGAMADYTQMVNIQPDGIGGYHRRGRARFFLGDYQGSVDDYSQVIKIDPKNEDAYARRCSTYLNLAEYEKAVSDCTEAIKIVPKNGMAYNNRCIAYLNLKEYQKSISDCTQRIELEPQNPEGYTNRGAAYVQDKQLQKAIEDYTQAIGLRPNQAEAYSNRGNIYSEQKEYQQAIADYIQAIRLNPKYARAYYNRGLVRVKMGDIKGAISDFEKAAKLYLEQGHTGGYKDAKYQIEMLR